MIRNDFATAVFGDMIMKHAAQSIFLALGILILVSASMAGPSVRKTKVTFSQAVRVPGATLSPGTYYFLAPLSEHRQIVNVQDDSGKTVARFMGILDYPGKPDHEFITFGDRVCGNTSIKAWYYPPAGAAVRFVYPPEEARGIAYGCNEPVPETRENPAGNTKLEAKDLYLVTPQKQEEPYKTEALTGSDQRDKDGFDAGVQ